MSLIMSTFKYLGLFEVLTLWTSMILTIFLLVLWSLFHLWEYSFMYWRKTLSISWGTNISPTFLPFLSLCVVFDFVFYVKVIYIYNISLFFLVSEFWDICIPDDFTSILSIWVPRGSKWHTHIRIIQEGFSYKETNLRGHGQVLGASHRSIQESGLSSSRDVITPGCQG